MLRRIAIFGRETSLVHSAGALHAVGWVVRILLFASAGLLSFLLRFDLIIPARCLPFIYVALLVWIPVKVAVFGMLRIHLRSWKYVSIDDFLHLASANVIASSISALIIAALSPPGFPRSIYVLDLLTTVLLSASVRAVAYVLANTSTLPATTDDKKRVLIYGAGNAGVMLVSEVRANATSP